MKIELPGYVPEKLPSGAIRHRVRVEGQKRRRITLEVGPEHPRFMEHYYAARAGVADPDADKPKPAANTLDWLTTKYLDRLSVEVEAGNKSPLTLRQRKNILGRCCDFLDDRGGRIGALHYNLGQAGVVHIMESFGAATSQADNAKKALSAMYQWAMPKNLISSNPAAGINNTHKNKGGAKPWKPSDVRKFIKRWPLGTTPYLWLMIAMCTVMRRSDAVWIGPKQEAVVDGRVWLDWQPQKKGSKRVTLPLLPPLVEAMKAMKVKSTQAYILSAHGRPFKNPAVMGNKVRSWCDDAGLEGLSQHGVRKALSELLAEAGCSDHQIMSVMAHTKAQTSAIYTENARRRIMAGSAMDAVSASVFSIMVSHDE